MPRGRDEQRALWRCVNPFSIFRGGVPEVYADGHEVLDNDPILKTHRDHFEPAAERVTRRTPVEQTTAAPGEYRTVQPAVEESDV
jgi:hypothetical protein